MAAKERLIQVLLGPAASRIRFSFPSGNRWITLGPGTFQRVASGIRANTVHIQTSTQFPPNTGAQYFAAADLSNTPPVPRANTLLMPPILGRVGESTALHECVHAAYDLFRTNINAWDEEASAYVAHVLYCKMTGLKQPRWSAPIADVASATADGLLAEYQRGAVRVPQVSRVSWELLRFAVLTSPTYLYANSPVLMQQNYNHDG
ncbi:MAG TPA: hypothetical protein VGN82_06720 [Bosea sp. (in: a-proteobacteria)]|jgi:hypothetical protein|uniref:hypothetical protein n=1 Tax=Bosea sp. (in: a-proteobacteria) TaxID=1871050 RepID=UPI002E13E0B5|nr:hypothetical protein [Bosea sp. (in: a-proteobacteria)]